MATMTTLSRTLPLLLLLLTISQLLSLSTASPLPELLYPRDEDSNNNDDDDNMPPYLVAIIVTCSLIGLLIFSAIAMSVFLCFRRRGAQPPSPIVEQPLTPSMPSTPTTIANEKRPTLGSPSCSWCYISENKVCKWCSGEDAQDDNSQDRPRGKLYVDSTDVRQSGWRSVLNSPSPSRNPSLRGGRSPEKSPAGSLKGGVEGGIRSPVGSISGKRSFRPGGIYEVTPNQLPDMPEKAAVRGIDDGIYEVECP